MRGYFLKAGKLFIISIFIISPLVVDSFFELERLISFSEKMVLPVDASWEGSEKEKIYYALLPEEKQSNFKQEFEIKNEKNKDSFSDYGVRGNFKIAVLGDSMVDVMQQGLPQVEGALKRYFPNASFELLNYGVGASNIESGYERLTNDYDYMGRHYKGLLSLDLDIIVIESFAYNHWGNNSQDLEKHRQFLEKIVNRIRNESKARVVLAATIGPDINSLCDGIEGMSLSFEQKKEKADTIKAYLDNLVNFARANNLALANAYHASLDENGYGKAVYVNSGDHLHPSGEGGMLMGEKIAEAIYKGKLL